MFRAFFVAAGAKRKTIELSVRSTTPRYTDPKVGYKHQSPLKLEYIRQEDGTSTDCAFSGQVDYSRACPSSCNNPGLKIAVTESRSTSRLPGTYPANFLEARSG
jgi:hypothetical protein